MTQTVQSFGQWVRERRKQRNLTQKGLGRLIGYAEITVRQIEHDMYNLTRFVVESVVNCLSDELDDREPIVRFALKQSVTSERFGKNVETQLSGTPFLGRESELTQLRTLLSSPECRCISIVGVGGIGKTRLALRAIDDFGSETEQTAWFVDL